MPLIAGITNPYLEALASGFLFGLVVCTSSCLPYIASYIAGINAGFRKGVFVTFIFNLGRITAYSLIGVIVGLFKLAISDPILSSFQQYAGPAFGVVNIIIGASLLFKSLKKQNCCKEMQKTESAKKIFGIFDVGAFTLGFSRGLVICTPLMALLAFSIPFASPIDSAILALLFGVGTSISPILLVGGATGWLLSKAPLFRKWVGLTGALVLIILGVITMFSTIII